MLDVAEADDEEAHEDASTPSEAGATSMTTVKVPKKKGKGGKSKAKSDASPIALNPDFTFSMEGTPLDDLKAYGKGNRAVWDFDRVKEQMRRPSDVGWCVLCVQCEVLLCLCTNNLKCTNDHEWTRTINRTYVRSRRSTTRSRSAARWLPRDKPKMGRSKPGMSMQKTKAVPARTILTTRLALRLMWHQMRHQTTTTLNPPTASRTAARMHAVRPMKTIRISQRQRTCRMKRSVPSRPSLI